MISSYRDKRTKSDSKVSGLSGQGLRGCHYPGAGVKARLAGSVQSGLMLGLQASRQKRRFPVTNPQQNTVTSPLSTSPNLYLHFCILVPHRTGLGALHPASQGSLGRLGRHSPLSPHPNPSSSSHPGATRAQVHPYHAPLGCILQGLDHFKPLFKPHLLNVLRLQAAEFLPVRSDSVRSGGTTEQRPATHHGQLHPHSPME